MQNRFISLATVVILACVYALSGSEGAHAQSADRSSASTESRFEQGLIRTGIMAFPAYDLIVAFAGDTLFLPLSDICDVLQLQYNYDEIRDSIVISGGERPASILLPLRKTMVLPEGRVQLQGGECVILEDQVFVEVETARRLLQVSWIWNAPRLSLDISPDPSLPAVINARNQRKYAALSLSKVSDRLTAPPVRRPLIGDMVLNWAINSSTEGESVAGGGFFQLGGPLLFGTMMVQADASYSSVTDKPSGALRSAQWQFVIPESRWLSRLSLDADWNTSGQVYRLELSNAPLSYREFFIDDQIKGSSQPGWMIEMYQAGRLVSVMRADSNGAYEFPIELRYGGNPFEIHEVNPYGERRVHRYTTLVRPEMLPPGSLDYSLTTGVLNPGRGDLLLGRMQARLGVTPWLSVASDVRLRPSSPASLAIDSVAAGTMADIWFGSASYLNVRYVAEQSALSARLQVPIIGNIPISLSIDQYLPTIGQVRGSLGCQFPLGFVQLGMNGRINFLHKFQDADLWTFAAGNLWRFNWSISSRFAAEPEFASTTENPRAGKLRWAHAGTSVQLMTSLFSSLMLRGMAEFTGDDPVPNRIEISPTLSLGRIGNLSVSYAVDGMNWREGRLQAQLDLELAPARLQLMGEEIDNRLVASAYATGSAVIGSAGVLPSPHSLLGQSTITVTGFLDSNGNGFRDKGEKDLGEIPARLFSDGLSMSDARTAFTGLMANTGYTVEIDRWAHAGEGLYPGRHRIALYALPSTLHAIDIPFSEGVDVTGQCELELSNGKKRTATAVFNGLQIRLRNEEHDIEYEGEVFQDGSIVAIGVAPGTYRLLMDEEQLMSRHLRVKYIPDIVTITEEQTTLPSIMFEPVPQSGSTTSGG